MDHNVIQFLPRGERGEVAEMRKSLLAVRDDHAAMQRVVMLTERVAAILDEITLTGADRQSLLWHVSVIRELATPQSE
jgi:hypothetical protein